MAFLDRMLVREASQRSTADQLLDDSFLRKAQNPGVLCTLMRDSWSKRNCASLVLIDHGSLLFLLLIARWCKVRSESVITNLTFATTTGSYRLFNGNRVVSQEEASWKKSYSQLLLYRTGVGTKIWSPVYKKSGISEYQTVYKTYCELFLRGTEILGPVCANSGMTESGIRAIDCMLCTVRQIGYTGFLGLRSSDFISTPFLDRIWVTTKDFSVSRGCCCYSRFWPVKVIRGIFSVVAIETWKCAIAI